MSLAMNIAARLLLIAACLSLGAVAWTLTEYLAHRFTMHSTGGRGPAAHEHLMHHARPARTRPLIRTVGHLSMYATATAIGWLLAFVLPTTVAVALAIGWAIGYTLYEGTHFHAHHHPPKGRYDLWLRKRHFHHHFGQPKTNLGVLVPWWDQLFGSEVAPGQIKVPRRVAMVWLLDEAGDVRAEYAADYIVVGRRPESGEAAQQRSAEQRELDIAAAFADQPLAFD